MNIIKKCWQLLEKGKKNGTEALTIVGRTDPKHQIHKDRKEFNTPNMTQLAGIV